jgi:predicted site-specific integrase-resolvase
MKEQYVPVWEYAEKHGVPIPTVYRWIRENKFPSGAVRVIKKTVEKLRVQADAKPAVRKKKK